MFRKLLRLVSVYAIGFVGVPCLVFGIMGVTGNLADVSEFENLQFGIEFFAYAAVAIAIGLFGLFSSTLFDVRKARVDANGEHQN